MVVFLAAYVMHDGTRNFLAQVAAWRNEMGFAFAFFSYVISAAILPEMLRVFFFQGGVATKANARNLLVAAPFWGCIGIYVDLFYRFQGWLFGTGNEWHIVVKKVLFDQFIYSPFFSLPFIMFYFLWAQARFRRDAIRSILQPGPFIAKAFSIQVAGWCVWIPGVSLVYFMPPLLQIPVAVLIQCLWILIFTTMRERQAAGLDRAPVRKTIRARS